MQDKVFFGFFLGGGGGESKWCKLTISEECNWVASFFVIQYTALKSVNNAWFSSEKSDMVDLH